jgi:hypothetical protein
MTYVLILNAKLREENERSEQTLDIGNMFKPTFGFKNSQTFQVKQQSYSNICSPLDSYLSTWEICTPLYFSRFGA